LQADYVTVVEDRPIMSVKFCLPFPVFHFWPKLTHPAIAEHLVLITDTITYYKLHDHHTKKQSWHMHPVLHHTTKILCTTQ